jgi:hypothetical protein
MTELWLVWHRWRTFSLRRTQKPTNKSKCRAEKGWHDIGIAARHLQPLGENNATEAHRCFHHTCCGVSVLIYVACSSRLVTGTTLHLDSTKQQQTGQTYKHTLHDPAAAGTDVCPDICGQLPDKQRQAASLAISMVALTSCEGDIEGAARAVATAAADGDLSAFGACLSVGAAVLAGEP